MLASYQAHEGPFGNSGSVIHPSRAAVVGDVKRTSSGNVAVRVGRAVGAGWCQTEYVVLTKQEAVKLAHTLLYRAIQESEDNAR